MVGSGPANAQPGGPEVPRAVLRAWDEAEARLFPVVMARPEEYKRSVRLIQELLSRLRETCPDIPALLAAHERGGDLAAAHERGGDLAVEVAADAADAGIRPELVAAAACAMRYRELAAALAAQRRLAALEAARGQGASWAVVEETGSPDRGAFVPYRRIEAETGSGRAVIVSMEPDETLSRVVHHLDRGRIDLDTGGLWIGEPIGSYLDPGEFTVALHQARES